MFGFSDVLIMAIVLALNCIYYITVFVAGDPILWGGPVFGAVCFGV